MKADGYVFQILPFLDGARPVKSIIADRGVHPSLALEITAGVATALTELHESSLIHADLKPSNILLIRSPSDIRLIDFGMARKNESTGAIQLIGTYSYLPPTLTFEGPRTSGSATEPAEWTPRTSSSATEPAELTPRTSSSATEPVELPEKATRLPELAVGPFIDLYALGVVALELLTGKSDPIPSPTEYQIHQRISDRNRWINSVPSSLQQRMVNLIFQLLTTSASRPGITARSAAALAKNLANEIGQGPHDDLSVIARGADGSDLQNRELTYPSIVSAQINFVKKEIAGRTTILNVAPNEFAASLATSEGNEEILAQLNNVFADARRRTQTSWRLSILLTLASFAVIVLLIVVAVAGSLVTREKLWAVVFGGLSASSVLGTLIWKPYDRLFRATILAQQIEVVHIRVTTGMRGTLEIEQQLKLLTEANNALRAIFRDHSQGARRN